MFDKWFKLPAHLYLRLTALTILTVGITLSNVLMSIGAIWIISNWIIEADYKNYWERFKKTKSVWFILFIFFFGILSVIWSDNAEYWFRDARMKLPLLAIPLAMATGPRLKKKHFHFLLFVFFGMLAYTTLWNYWHFIDDTSAVTEIRKMSRFISHVRLSTLLVLGIFAAIYCVVKNIGNRLIIALLIPWFLFYLLKSQVLNGYLLFAVISVSAIIYVLLNIKNVKYKYIAGVTFAIGSAVAIMVLINLVSSFTGIDQIDKSKLPTKTANGNDYYHNFNDKYTENGHYVWLNMCQYELEKEWNNRSEIAYDSLNRKGEVMFGTLMRYMTSKNLNKDSIGVWSLSEEEITLIENGTSSAVASEGIKARLQSFIHDYETYKMGGDPNGHSLMQRLEHLKTAWFLLGDHWLLGVGTGDLNDTFQQAYIETDSALILDNRLRAHNQFLSIWIAMGLVGFIAFVLAFVFPIVENPRRDFFLVIFMVALFFSCLFQDVLETQAGITIFALFYSLAAYRQSEKELNPEAHS